MSGNRIDLIHKEPIMEFVSSSDTMPLQIYKAFMMWSISLVLSGLHYWAGNVDLISTNTPIAHILIQTRAQSHCWAKLHDLSESGKWLTALRSSSLQALPNSTGPT